MTGAFDRIGKKVILFHQIIGEMLILLGQTIYFFGKLAQQGQHLCPNGHNRLRDIAGRLGHGLFCRYGACLADWGGTAEIRRSEYNRCNSRPFNGQGAGPGHDEFSCCGRAGSAMAAELGVMKVYEEIDALKTLDINPVHYLAIPRFIACIVCVPALVIYSDCIGIAGGAIISNLHPEIFVSS